MSAVAAWLPCGTRLHLQHGPIDLILGADRPGRALAFAAAEARFCTVLEELVAELPHLRSAVTAQTPLPKGAIARQMWHAVRPHGAQRVTPMAAVAGAVADTVLRAMTEAAPLRRAYVNNGGDIALHLSSGAAYTTAMSDHHAQEIGRIRLTADTPVRGVATSGRHGRSLSLGVADAVTVLAGTAAQADVAATLIANAVDLPGHPAITRQAACTLDPDSDLGTRPVVTGCGPLTNSETAQALDAGDRQAARMQTAGLIHAAALHLNGQTRLLGPCLTSHTRSLSHA